ncbi:MAG: DUF3179 domain-containing (seleno)protein [Pseudomonadota bacterium]
MDRIRLPEEPMTDTRLSRRALLGGALALPFGAPAAVAAAGELPATISDDPLANSRFLLFGARNLRRQSLRWAKRRGRTDMVAALINSLRYVEADARREAANVLQKLTGARIGADWARWVRWQQQHPEIRPFADYDVFLSALFGSLDEGFQDFIFPGVAHRIRLEEIVWGGVRARDGIPALNDPRFLPAASVDWLDDREPVFGVALDGDVRALPHRILDWHEMFNGTIGGQPVALAYCTLCAAGILYSRRVAGVDAPLTFGSSGLLYRSNKLMFDTHSNSLWNQFSGRPVVGAWAMRDLELSVMPVATTTWGAWRRRHPHTRVLDRNTGFAQDYRPGKAYGAYFRSRDLMFPVATDGQRGRPKDRYFVLRLGGQHAAWPLSDFAGGAVVNAQVGVLSVVLVGDAKTRAVRAYRSDGRPFRLGPGSQELTDGDERFEIREAELLGQRSARRFARLPGHLGYGFGWQTFLAPSS